ELIERKLHYAWWGNLRFDKAFTPELANEMARAGCISVSGGLEVASERILKLMDKGITIEQVTRVCRAFRDAKINVNAYLMYGFPTQTEQEIVDALEVTRQLFANRLLTTASWHWFQATAHSPIGRTPERFDVTLKRDPPSPHGGFATYILEHETPTPHRAALSNIGGSLPLSRGGVRGPYKVFSGPLWWALKNFERGSGLDSDVSVWFESLPDVPKTTISPDLIAGYLRDAPTPHKSPRYLPLVTSGGN
ncbi:MAG: radical SAM protein, partial [Kofleriaceae bacterium]